MPFIKAVSRHPHCAPSDQLTGILQELGQLLRKQSAKIRDLEEQLSDMHDRIEDLEGHAEHDGNGTCGVCSPETVGPDVYAPVQIATTEGSCQNPHCADMIKIGDMVIKVDEGTFIHDYC